MTYRWRRIAAISLCLAFAGTVATPVAASPLPARADAPGAVAATGNPDFHIERLAGSDRYATAALISKRFFSPGVPVAFVVTGQNFPDGLAAGPAAAKLGGPVLYVLRTAVPAATLAELQRLKPQRIVVVGSTAVIAENVRTQLAALAPSGATRVAGSDRYATAAALAQAYFASAPVVYVATGQNFPDALAAGPAAAAKGGLILLTLRDTLPAVTRDQLSRLHPARIVVVGSTAVVSAAVETALHAYASSVVRLAGSNRYATAIAISKDAFATAPAAFLAYGENYPDALAAISPAGRQKLPILLVPTTLLLSNVGSELDRLDPDRVFILGSWNVISATVQKQTQRTLGICWAANHAAAGTQQTFSIIPDAPNQVALTYDMGGRLDPAVQIMQYLIDHQVCATIFPTGDAAQTTIGRRVLAMVRDHPELFEVGNHTVNHCHLVLGGGPLGCPTSPPSATFIAQELLTAETIIKAQTLQTTVPYWRPPFGEVDSRVKSAAAAAGYTKTFMWHLDTIDWDPATSTSEIISRVVPKAVSGSVVLNHLGGYATLDALPSVVSGLRSRGFTLTTVSDMLD